jgi:VIT1/CCC1 family predicted Fe2+/Mn2+ transporter
VSSFISVKTFPTRPEAELAKGILEAGGIRAVVTADDAGGMRPELAFSRGVRLLVEVGDATRARELLAAEEPPETAAERRLLGVRLRGCMVPALGGFLLLGVGSALSDGVHWLGVTVILAGLALLVTAIVRGMRAA